MDWKRKAIFLAGLVVVVMAVLWVPQAAGQSTYLVNCSGVNVQPGEFTSINQVLPQVMNGDTVIIDAGPCMEDVTLSRLVGVNFGTSWGNTVALQGSLTATDSTGLFIYGLNVTSATGDGITVQYSHDITLDRCTSSGNAGKGLNVQSASDVSVSENGSFNNNGSDGIAASGNSTVNLVGWGGLIDVSNNITAGIYAERSVVTALGNLHVANTKVQAGSEFVSGYGIDFRGAASGYIIGLWAPAVIEGNDTGGMSLQENSEFSLLGGDPSLGWTPIVIQSNGSTGVTAAFGSQLTVWTGDQGIQVLNHSSAGIDVHGNSQVFIHGRLQIMGNGFGTDPMRAGLRVDGNSEAFLRGGEMKQNNGPGILALVNSSVDLAGVTVQGNSGGTVVCDSSAYAVADAAGNPGYGWTCKAPHAFGNHHHWDTKVNVPDWSVYVAKARKYAKVAKKK